MHRIDLKIEHITKVEGDASMDVVVEDGKVTNVKFAIIEYKRFFTTAMKGRMDATLAVSKIAAIRLTTTTKGKPLLLPKGNIW